MLEFLAGVRERTRRIFNATRLPNENSWKSTTCAAIQASCGTILAVYTYKSSSPIGTFMCSMIAVDGAYKVYKGILREKPILVEKWRTLKDRLEDLPHSRLFRIGCYAAVFSLGRAVTSEVPEEEITIIDDINMIGLLTVLGLFLYESCAEALNRLNNARNGKTLTEVLQNPTVLRCGCYVAFFSGWIAMFGSRERMPLSDEFTVLLLALPVFYNGCGAALNYCLRPIGIKGKVIMNLAFGTYYYIFNTRLFSKVWRMDLVEENAFFLFVANAALGYYIAVSAANSLERAFNRKPLLKICLSMLEPALIASTAAYLFFFQNHLEEWPYWRWAVAFGAAGIKLLYWGNRRGLIRARTWETPRDLLKDPRLLIRIGCYAAFISGIVAIIRHIPEQEIPCADEFALAMAFLLVVYDGCGTALNFCLRSTAIEGNVVLNLVLGTEFYISSVEIFSWEWKNASDPAHFLYIAASLGFAASCYYINVSSVNRLVAKFNRKPCVKFCLLMFEPALIASTTIYLFYFQNHLDEWPYWRLVFAFGAAGIKLSKRGNHRIEEIQSDSLAPTQ